MPRLYLQTSPAPSSVSFPSRLRTTTFMHFSFPPHAFHMLHLSHPRLFFRPNAPVCGEYCKWHWCSFIHVSKCGNECKIYFPTYSNLDWEYFTFMWPCIVTNFIIIKPTRYTNFTNLFWRETLHVSDSSSVHHQEFIHWTLSNGVCHTGL
jgi:hypothetical protein